MTKTFTLEEGATLHIRDQGAYLYIEVNRPNDGKGLYRASLRGLVGSQSLGTLSPEGTRLKLARMIPKSTLERWGCFPVTGGECARFFSFTQEEESEEEPLQTYIKDPIVVEETQWQSTEEPKKKEIEGWEVCDNPSERVVGETLGEGFSHFETVLMKEGEKGFSLAVPVKCEEEFPLTPLLCIGKTLELEGEQWVAFGFTNEGKPVLEK